MISFSICLDSNKGIGYKGGLPWHIKEELQLFKRNTLNKNIIMGKTTYVNLPNKLKDRHIFVAVKGEQFQENEVEIIDDLIEFCQKYQNDEEEFIICGGASIYNLAYKYCKKGYVSILKESYVVDTYFEQFNLSDFQIIEKVEYEKFTYYCLSR